MMKVNFLLQYHEDSYEHCACVCVCVCVCVDRDTEVEACQRFFREGLSLSFNRILTDDAVSTWKPDIQV